MCRAQAKALRSNHVPQGLTYYASAFFIFGGTARRFFVSILVTAVKRINEGVIRGMDVLLLRAVRGSSENALRQIIDKYTAYVCTIIRNTVGERMAHEDIEEVASDVFFALWESVDKLKKENLKAYLGAIARNKAINKLREIRENLPLGEEFIAADDTPEDTLILDAERSAVKSAILAMETPDRDIFLRHYYGTQTVAAIASETGMTESAIKHRLVRGREKLRRIIDKEVFEK